MHEQHPPAPGNPHNDSHATRVEYAKRDLEATRVTELADLNPAGLILLVERLRTRLDDMLQLIDEIGAD